MFPQPTHKIEIKSPLSGFVQAVNARAIGEAANLLGAGRSTPGDPIDHAVGVANIAPIGTEVKESAILAVLHVNDTDQLETVQRNVLDAFTIGDKKVDPPLLIAGVIKE
jgi:thymidine phosphorylase